MDVWTERKKVERSITQFIIIFNTVVIITIKHIMNQTGIGETMNLLSNDVIRFDQLTIYLITYGSCLFGNPLW